MKKYVFILAVILLICCLSFVLVACGEKQTAETNSSSQSISDQNKDNEQQEEKPGEKEQQEQEEEKQEDYSSAEITSAKNIVFDGTNGHYTVPNATKTYSFINEIEVSENATWQLCTDINAQNFVPSKTVPLEEGDNTFYILVTSGDEKNIGFYIVTIRRRPIYTVVFNTNGGTSCESQSIEEGKSVSEPTTTKDGYSFDCWKQNDTKFDFVTSITNDITLDAIWNTIEYSITYNLDGGTNNENNPATYTIEDKTIALVTPTKTGYTFVGWYSDSTYINKVMNISKGSYGDKTLYAKWTITSYKIYYTLNGGVVNGTNLTTYTIESDEINLINPTKKYYSFLGWSGTDIEGNSTSVTIEKGSYGDRNYTANWQAIEEMSNFEFTSTDTTCTIKGIKDKTVTTIVVPDYVTSISQGALNGCNQLESIIVSDDNRVYCSKDNCIIEIATKTLVAGCKTSIISNDGSVTNIGECAFRGCNGLTNINVPDCVTSIGSAAFQNCIGLTNVTIGNGVTSLPEGLFSGCSSLESMALPFVGGYIRETFSNRNTLFGYIFGVDNYDGGILIKQYYDYYSSGAGNYYTYCIPSSLKNITIASGDVFCGAFWGCKNLTSITLGNGIKHIGKYAFEDCSGLTAVHITDLAAWCNIAFVNEQSNPLYYAKKLYLNGELVTDLVIPNGVTSIGDYAFRYCSGLTSVTIGNSVTSIGSYAFYGCSGLTSVTIGNSVTSIGDYAFAWCSKLTSITIPSSVTSIGEDAFAWCDGLTSVTIGNSVTSIGERAFYNCSGLTSVTIGNSVTSIGREAFYNCSGLKNITFNGTLSRWNEIEKGSGWKYNVLAKVVHCSDVNIGL